MAYIDQPFQTKEVAAFLGQVRKQGTPLRVDSDTETYYLLTATQLQELLLSVLADRVDVANFADDESFSLADFGLTEDDVAAYEAAQARQRAALHIEQQQLPDPELIRRLDALPHFAQLFPKRAAAEREELLRELETAMLVSLQSSIANHP